KGHWVNLKWAKLGFSALAVSAMLGFIVCLNLLQQYVQAVPQGRFIWLSDNRLVLGIILLIFTVTIPYAHQFIRFIFSNKLVVAISLISYNLFLWHYLIIL